MSGPIPEFWDQDSQLLYLRARRYDPKIGRFISADPFEGRQGDPRSLNRYLYAGGDPHHATDPSGKMSLGEIGSTLGTIANLASRAMNAYDMMSMLMGAGEDEEASESQSERGSIWDSFMAMAISAMDPSAYTGSSGSLASIGGIPLGGGSTRTEDHHAIPVYLCGSNYGQRPLVTLEKPAHDEIHRQLNKVPYAVNVLGASIHFVLTKNRTGKNKKIANYIRYVARNKTGRTAIFGKLMTFYAMNYYSGTQYLHLGKTSTIQDALFRYGRDYRDDRAKTSWGNQCVR